MESQGIIQKSLEAGQDYWQLCKKAQIHPGQPSLHLLLEQLEMNLKRAATPKYKAQAILVLRDRLKYLENQVVERSSRTRGKIEDIELVLDIYRDHASQIDRLSGDKQFLTKAKDLGQHIARHIAISEIGADLREDERRPTIEELRENLVKKIQDITYHINEGKKKIYSTTCKDRNAEIWNFLNATDRYIEVSNVLEDLGDSSYANRSKKMARARATALKMFRNPETYELRAELKRTDISDLERSMAKSKLLKATDHGPDSLENWEGLAELLEKSFPSL